MYSVLKNIKNRCYGIGTSYFESNLEMLHIIRITSVNCYILASFKLVCELPDNAETRRRNETLQYYITSASSWFYK
jgi:hypothetical protein